MTRALGARVLDDKVIGFFLLLEAWFASKVACQTIGYGWSDGWALVA